MATITLQSLQVCRAGSPIKIIEQQIPVIVEDEDIQKLEN
jgi:hypothetical protein